MVHFAPEQVVHFIPERVVHFERNRQVVTIDIGLDSRLQLSEITEEITKIELELTDESIINPDIIRKVHVFDSLVFISQNEIILLFNMEGEFIRSIGSKGQGPGEYLYISSFTVDEKNLIIYIVGHPLKIISYDLNGKFLKEHSIGTAYSGQMIDIDCFNNEILVLAELIREKQNKENERLNCFHSVIYKINNEMQFIDSCFIRDVYFEGHFSKGWLYDYLTYNNSVVYLYNPELTSFYINFHPPLQQLGPIDRVLRDTLYRFENNRLVPELKLEFKRNGRNYNKDKYIQLFNIYRSSRYVFLEYETENMEKHFHFCYDIKKGISYNSNYDRVEFLSERKKMIRPISNNTELFYYLQTNMAPDTFEEPNPTLYIGKLKRYENK